MCAPSLVPNEPPAETPLASLESPPPPPKKIVIGDWNAALLILLNDRPKDCCRCNDEDHP